MAKRHIYSTLVFILIAFCSFGQTVVQANKVIAKDSLRIGSKWVYFIVTDSTFTDVNHRQVASAKAIRDFVLANSGLGAVDSIAVLQDSIIVGYSAGDEVTRDTFTFPAAFNFSLRADGSTVTLLNAGDTVRILGGFGVNASISGANITLDVDTSQVVGLYTFATTIAAFEDAIDAIADSLAAALSGTLTNFRLPVATGTKTLSSSILLQGSSGIILDADKWFRITGGTTVNRPTGAAGAMYWNTTNNWLDIYDGTAWRNVAQISTTNGLGTGGLVPRFDSNGRITNGIIRDDGTTLGIGVAASGSYGLNIAQSLPAPKIRFELSGTSQAYIDWDAGSTVGFRLGKNATGAFVLIANSNNATSLSYYNTSLGVGINEMFPTEATFTPRWRSNTSGHTNIAKFLGSTTSTDYAIITNAGWLGIRTSPSQSIHTSANIRVQGAYYDSSNSPGTSGYFLNSTGTGTAWTAFSLPESTRTFRLRNGAAGTINTVEARDTVVAGAGLAQSTSGDVHTISTYQSFVHSYDAFITLSGVTTTYDTVEFVSGAKSNDWTYSPTTYTYTYNGTTGRYYMISLTAQASSSDAASENAELAVFRNGTITSCIAITTLNSGISATGDHPMYGQGVLLLSNGDTINTQYRSDQAGGIDIDFTNFSLIIKEI